MQRGGAAFVSLVSVLLAGCNAPAYQPQHPELPSLAYSQWVKAKADSDAAARRHAAAAAAAHDPSMGQAARAQLHMVRQSLDAQAGQPMAELEPKVQGDIVTNELLPGQADVEIYRSSQPMVRDYNGPLALGDPGLSSSLWQESRSGNELFRDQRAWQPMDMITVVISENAEGEKTADTEIKGKSDVSAQIQDWIGIINSLSKKNPEIVGDDGTLVEASTTNNYKGEGETTRKDTLKATISAMVAEVLPGNILRIEGEKIISLNQEEQTIIISGLVRPWDINSNNEVPSAKVANLRIDYYGRGTVGEAQYGGWFSRMMRVLWPF